MIFFPAIAIMQSYRFVELLRSAYARMSRGAETVVSARSPASSGAARARSGCGSLFA
jgi:hypothetical protein